MAASAAISISPFQVLRISHLLEAMRWSYCAIWVQTSHGELSCQFRDINKQVANPLELEHLLHLYCAYFIPSGLGFAGAAISTGSHKWVCGMEELLQQSPLREQTQFFRDASIQTVLCIPCESGVILELGTTDLMQEDHETLKHIHSFLWPKAPALDSPRSPQLVQAGAAIDQVSFPTIELQEGGNGDDTLSSNTYSSEFPLSNAQKAGSIDHEYGSDVLEQLYIDMNTVGKTVSSLPVAMDHCAMRYVTCLPTRAATNNPCSTQIRGQYSPLTDSVVQREGELTVIPQNAWTIEPLDAQLGVFSDLQLDENEHQLLLPADAMMFGSSSVTGTSLDSHPLTPQHPTYTRDSCGRSPPLMMSSSSATQLSTGTRAASPKRNEVAHQHMLAERIRRRKQNASYKNLKTLVPDVKKTIDKNSLLVETIHYVNSLKQKLADLQQQNIRLQIDASNATQSSLSKDEGVSSASPQSNVGTLSQIQKLEVICDSAANFSRPAPVHIELEIASQAPVDTVIKLLNSLKQRKLNCFRIKSKWERDKLRAKFSAEFEDQASPSPNADELRNFLRNAL